MTTSVLVQRHCPGGPHAYGTGSGPGHPHGGPYDCGCGRAGCHDEFAALSAGSSPAARAALRTQLIEVHLSLADRIARRYRSSGPGFDDIRQVAALALVEAVNRFDPGMGTAFSAFAVPTITGAIKKHFRDQSWTVHPPRRVKELRMRIRAVTDLLTQQLRRTPSVVDLADHLGCTQREIIEALCTDDALRPLSIDAPVRGIDDDVTVAATLGGPDAGYTLVDDVETLRPLLAELPERERRVLAMRFVDNLTQSQIADRVGCSQMHVSRILRTALERLRQALRTAADDNEDGDEPAAGAGATVSRRGMQAPPRAGNHHSAALARPSRNVPPAGRPTSVTHRRHEADPATVTPGRPARRCTPTRSIDDPSRPGRPAPPNRRAPVALTVLTATTRSAAKRGRGRWRPPTPSRTACRPLAPPSRSPPHASMRRLVAAEVW